MLAFRTAFNEERCRDTIRPGRHAPAHSNDSLRPRRGDDRWIMKCRRVLIGSRAALRVRARVPRRVAPLQFFKKQGGRAMNASFMRRVVAARPTVGHWLVLAGAA